jgi:hypothetical protein
MDCMIEKAKNKTGRQIIIRVVGSGATLTRISTRSNNPLLPLDGYIPTVLKAFEKPLISQKRLDLEELCGDERLA